MSVCSGALNISARIAVSLVVGLFWSWLLRARAAVLTCFLSALALSLLTRRACVPACATRADLCCAWRDRASDAEAHAAGGGDREYADVLDGAVFRSFFSNSGLFSDASKLSLLLQLSIDWFQPFKRAYSIGLVTMFVMNLPRSERYKPENTILVSVITGPHEPKQTVNSLLQPLVAELEELRTGTVMSSFTHPDGRRVRAALGLVVADTPARAKTLGFLSHNAKVLG